MKRLLFAFTSLFLFQLHAAAQPKKSGAIQFESTFDPAAMAAANGIKLSDQAIARMPQRSVTNFELLFNLTNASYMAVEDTEDSNNSGGSFGPGGGLRFGGFGGAGKDYYYNFDSHQLSQVFDLNDTTYVMPDKLGARTPGGNFGPEQATPVVNYSRTDETKKILGFTCYKVVMTTTVKRRIGDEEKEITDQTNLWFTNELGFDFSPNPSMWTEGAVLAIEGKATHIFAKSIEFRNVSSRDVNLPKKVTTISPEAFRSKMEMRRKQMRGNRNGNNGQVRTITIN